ncbi:glycosyltransferase family 4 protein [Jonesia denitrificans]|uniref:D-inositol 3-phosphate glycosyltransferase n=1 Tax=Jonesia denitrificans (strain ATCC 14870 / DSM 20603 / BCRC 15368 / CIP 55.134 / JCM 11481 / NBRC 15587 / NCTC 10816 / Prevot 55134) TaxID=471856 RepID=C7R4H3_JONDD|nr:glycosyltransferase family 4 protein [Jonesia denitrificans]ACV09030.1 glycosyl transferase group 1 [Jonesia denitrificans DSM 20603]ASE09677.1 glycosyltransferase family 1 protein [Jonesia denitrificans]QXB44216.1 glycosyltransferase family 4 protein [Jonesia denitrificans]SQH21156.1 GDP-mannose-dependent alpha-(1-2)-phosphatidylinositol mannosyltransferase [Jonesia denitrificans]
MTSPHTHRTLRVGIVCPYSFDAPGGVQFHIRDLAEALINQGHEVSVLAPADDDTPVPPYLTPAGASIPIRYNGSVARLTFGPRVAAKVRRWLNDGQFDILHLHEPMTPSLSMLALWLARGPIVGTFHTALIRSRALQFVYPMVRPSLEKFSARIAVSEDARRTLIDHLGGDAIVIPNGVYVNTFTHATPTPQWQGTPDAPTIAFLGRLDEPRKGLPVLSQAIPHILTHYPNARFLIAGKGDEGKRHAEQQLSNHLTNVEFLGAITDDEKASLLTSVDLYIAPQTGGESFGIVLVEAMSAGTTVIASDLGAFERVLDNGQAGYMFRTNDPNDLARAVIEALNNPTERTQRTQRATEFVQQFDWKEVTTKILTVYEMVLSASTALGKVTEDPSALTHPREAS